MIHLCILFIFHGRYNILTSVLCFVKKSRLYCGYIHDLLPLQQLAAKLLAIKSTVLVGHYSAT